MLWGTRIHQLPSAQLPSPLLCLRSRLSPKTALYPPPFVDPYRLDSPAATLRKESRFLPSVSTPRPYNPKTNSDFSAFSRFTLKHHKGRGIFTEKRALNIFSQNELYYAAPLTHQSTLLFCTNLRLPRAILYTLNCLLLHYSR